MVFFVFTNAFSCGVKLVKLVRCLILPGTALQTFAALVKNADRADLVDPRCTVRSLWGERSLSLLILSEHGAVNFRWSNKIGS